MNQNNNESIENTIPNVNSKEKEERNVPDLRFTQDIWKKYKFNELLSIVSSKNKEGKKLKILSASQVYGMVDASKLDLKIKREATDYTAWKIIEKGDYVIHLRSFQGGFAYTYEDGICCPAYTVLRPINNKFLIEGYFKHYFNSKKFINSLVPFIYGIRDGKSIMIFDWLNTEIKIPPISEQLKIIRFLDMVDKRISTQKKIIEDLIILKNNIINSIYETQKYNCKLGNCIIQVANRNKKGKINEVLSVSNKLGFIKQSEQFEEREVASDDITNYKIIENNMFAYNPARINVGSIAKYNLSTPGIVSPMYTCFKTNNNIDANYLNYYFDSNEFKKQMRKRLEGSVRLCLTYESMINIPFYLPSFDIQKKNAVLLTAFINKIDFEKKYLNLLESQKAYLLNKMFI